jgi:hypothetical protein
VRLDPDEIWSEAPITFEIERPAEELSTSTENHEDLEVETT